MEQAIEVGNLRTDLLSVLIWPLIFLFVLFYFREPLKGFVDNLQEFTFNAFGVQATAKRQQIEAATLLGAASARHGPLVGPQIAGGNAQEIANVVTQSVTPRAVRKLLDTRLLWVDDRPTNNIFECRALEALGIRTMLSITTEDALNKTLHSRMITSYSYMGRPPDARAGYTLLDALRKRGDQTPFIIYAGSDNSHIFLDCSESSPRRSKSTHTESTFGFSLTGMEKRIL